jgi:phosphatidylserine/phosphatidylglycerophosphate/cardiolipin synthase-like enzyme
MRKAASAGVARRTPASGPSEDRVVVAIDQRRQTVLEVIRSARKRLLISIFRCTDVPVLDAIAEARDRDVEVRLLLTPRARGWEKRLKELGAYLESMGVQVHPYSDPVVKYHAKYIVADDGPALVASMNFTAKCFAATCDFLLVTSNSGVVSGLTTLFEADWLAPHSNFPASVSQRLIVGPERARAQITSILGSAARSIQIIDHKMKDALIDQLLKQKKSAGVEVEILKPEYFGGLLPHGKLIIVDGKIAVFGSMALAALSMDFRREVAIAVDHPKCIRKLKDFYRFLANGGQVLPPGFADQFLRKEEE